MRAERTLRAQVRKHARNSAEHSNLGELNMNMRGKNGSIIAVLFVLTLGIFTSATWADVKNYEFRLVHSEIKKGEGAVIAVRLVDKRSGKTIPDAVIFAKRLDMAPDAMQEMTAPLEQLPASEAGVYRFKTDLTMEGRWRLSLRKARLQASWSSRLCHEPRPRHARARRHPGGGYGRVLAWARGRSLARLRDKHDLGPDRRTPALSADYLLPRSRQ